MSTKQKQPMTSSVLKKKEPLTKEQQYKLDLYEKVAAKLRISNPSLMENVAIDKVIHSYVDAFAQDKYQKKGSNAWNVATSTLTKYSTAIIDQMFEPEDRKKWMAELDKHKIVYERKTKPMEQVWDEFSEAMSSSSRPKLVSPSQVSPFLANSGASMAGPSTQPIDPTFHLPKESRQIFSTPEEIQPKTRVDALEPAEQTIGAEDDFAVPAFKLHTGYVNPRSSARSDADFDGDASSVFGGAPEALVEAAQRNIRTAQGGGGEHAVMPRTNDYVAPSMQTNMIGQVLDSYLKPAVHSMLQAQTPNVYQSAKPKGKVLRDIGSIPKRSEFLDDALWKQPRDPSNADEHQWFSIGNSFSEPAKIGTISGFEKYHAKDPHVNLIGFMGAPFGTNLDDRWTQCLNPFTVRDVSTQPNGRVDWTRNLLTSYGMG